ncbi:hypothetical protein, partial [Faecalicatena contorta]|uniref:hypothetical protein n=1 Tax=Faecalicatena contorta TaxID=39482 RepID=UPI0032180B96
PGGIPDQGSGCGLAMRIFSSSRCVLNYFDTGTVSHCLCTPTGGIKVPPIQYHTLPPLEASP